MGRKYTHADAAKWAAKQSDATLTRLADHGDWIYEGANLRSEKTRRNDYKAKAARDLLVKRVANAPTQLSAAIKGQLPVILTEEFYAHDPIIHPTKGIAAVRENLYQAIQHAKTPAEAAKYKKWLDEFNRDDGVGGDWFKKGAGHRKAFEKLAKALSLGTAKFPHTKEKHKFVTGHRQEELLRHFGVNPDNGGYWTIAAAEKINTVVEPSLQQHKWTVLAQAELARREQADEEKMRAAYGDVDAMDDDQYTAQAEEPFAEEGDEADDTIS